MADLADLRDIPPIAENARPRVERHPNQIVRVELHDDNGPASNPYVLKEGENRFYSYAVFSDGTRERFPCYWRCFPRGARDGTMVFGTSRKDEVVLSRHANHEQYMQLSCWAKNPKAEDPDIPVAGIGFRYSDDGL